MNTKAIYNDHCDPVPLEKVIDGLWVAQAEQKPDHDDKDFFFRSIKLFANPMIKVVQKKPLLPAPE